MYSIFMLFALFAIINAIPMQQNSDKQSTYNVNSIKSQDKTVPTSSPSKTEDNSEKDNQYTAAASQILENPSYDPNIYNSFLPHDAIQQYVNQYGSPYPATSYFPVPGAYAVQTGYEGYLVPTTEVVADEGVYSSALTFVRSLMPRSMVGWILKGAVYTLSALGIVILGGALTTAICTLTPLCTISFSTMPFLRLRNSAQVVGKALSAEITPERIQRTAELVQTAIEKFSQMQEPEDNKKKIA